MGGGRERLAARVPGDVRGRAQGFALGQRDEGLARLQARAQVLDAGQKAVTAGVGQQQRGGRRPGEEMHELGAGLELDEAGERLAVAARARQRGHGHGIHAAVAAEGDQRVHRAAFEGAIERVAGLEGEAGRFVRMAAARAHPAFLRDDDGDGFVEHLDFGHRLLLGLDQGAARVGEGFGVGLDLAHHEAAQRRGRGEDVVEPRALLAQFGKLLLDADGFEPGELAQADFQDVLGLAIAEAEARDQRGLGLVAGADDGDDLVHVEQHRLPPFEDVDAVEHLGQPVAGAPLDGGVAKRDPLRQQLPQRLEHRPPVEPDGGEVDRRGGLQAGVRQQRAHQLGLFDAAAARLEHQAHRGFLARLVAHGVEHGEHAGLELVLLGGERLLAGLDLGVGELLDFLEHALRTHAGRQFGDDELPLAARKVFDLPARAHLERAAAAAVGLGNLGGAADDLRAAGVVGAAEQGEQRIVGERRVLDERDAGVGHLAQVVAGNFGGQAHGNAAGAIEQRKRQPRGQLARLFGGAVVVGREVDRAFVEFVEQQPCDAREPRLGVAHGGGAVAVAAAEVALPVDERVALRKILRHAHQRVVGRLVAVGVKAPEHVADHARALDRLGRHRGVGPAIAQAHAVHGIEDAPLHGLLAVAHVGQRAALDDGERVFEVGTLGVSGQAGGLGVSAGGVEKRGFGHCGGRSEAAAASACARPPSMPEIMLARPAGSVMRTRSTGRRAAGAASAAGGLRPS